MAAFSRVRCAIHDSTQWIRVIDVFPQRHRYLQFEDSVQGILCLDQPHVPVLEYVGVMEAAARWLRPSAARILAGGLGSGALVLALGRWQGKPHLVTIEANATVYRLARKYFRLPPDGRVRLGDLRTFLEEYEDPVFDLAFIDCYTASSMPFHLTTLEFMDLLQQKLAPGGAVVWNLWSPDCNQRCGDQLRTLAEAFGEAAVIHCREDANLVVLTRKTTRTTGTWIQALSYKQRDYPLRLISGHERSKWPFFMRDANLLEDRNAPGWRG